MATAIGYDENGDPYEYEVYEEPAPDTSRRDRVVLAYKEALGREPESEAVIQAHLNNPGGLAGAIQAIYLSPEAQAYGKKQAEKPSSTTTPTTPPVSPISTSTDPTSTSPVPRTAANPFGSNAVAATDVGMSNMIERDKPSWEAYLRANWPKDLAWDPGAIDGVIRQLSYASNAGQDPKKFIDQALANAKTRSQSGGPITDSEGRLTGNYNTDWNDLDPSRLGGKDPSAAYKTAMGSLQTQLDAERDPTKRNALQAKMAAMFNGAYVGPPPSVSTLGAITSSAPTVPTNTAATTPAPPPAARPTATQTPSAPVQPYSARATTPYTTEPSAPSTVTSQVPMAGMPAAPVTTMGNMLGSTQPQNPYALANAWNTTNANYRQAGDAYAAQQGGNYNPAPWSGTRLGAPRNALGTPTTVGSPNDVALATDAAERRRAYRFGMQNAQANQANAAMGQQDFNGQMDNWLRAYNEWNKKGVDPLAVPGGVV